MYYTNTLLLHNKRVSICFNLFRFKSIIYVIIKTEVMKVLWFPVNRMRTLYSSMFIWSLIFIFKMLVDESQWKAEMFTVGIKFFISYSLQCTITKYYNTPTVIYFIMLSKLMFVLTTYQNSSRNCKFKILLSAQ